MQKKVTEQKGHNKQGATSSGGVFGGAMPNAGGGFNGGSGLGGGFNGGGGLGGGGVVLAVA